MWECLVLQPQFSGQQNKYIEKKEKRNPFQKSINVIKLMSCYKTQLSYICEKSCHIIDVIMFTLMLLH